MIEFKHNELHVARLYCAFTNYRCLHMVCTCMVLPTQVSSGRLPVMIINHHCKKYYRNV